MSTYDYIMKQKKAKIGELHQAQRVNEAGLVKGEKISQTDISNYNKGDDEIMKNTIDRGGLRFVINNHPTMFMSEGQQMSPIRSRGKGTQIHTPIGYEDRSEGCKENFD